VESGCVFTHGTENRCCDVITVDDCLHLFLVSACLSCEFSLDVITKSISTLHLENSRDTPLPKLIWPLGLNHQQSLGIEIIAIVNLGSVFDLM
jgi:hypothetical protein